MVKVKLSLILLVAVALFLMSTVTFSATIELTLVQDGKANAAIITAKNPTFSANLAALELQYHIEKITGAVLPIKTEDKKVRGIRILVGESQATRKLGLKSSDFKPQEYLIRILPEAIVLIGRDWLDTEENRNEVGVPISGPSLQKSRHIIDYFKATGRTPKNEAEKKTITLPGVHDDQGTCYAAYDFLERFCDVRWYGPSEINVVFPKRATLVVKADEIRRALAIRYRGLSTSTRGLEKYYRIAKVQWDNPGQEELYLFWRRMRVGGEKWGSNHSLYGYHKRFRRTDPNGPEPPEGEHPEYFAKGCTGRWCQLCYTNPAVVKQVAQDARDFFDGKGLKPGSRGIGNYYDVVPGDGDKWWCKCENCQAIVEKHKDNIGLEHGFSGEYSHYWFSFVNAVAREVRKTHPDKYISTLVYHQYAFYPEGMELESNIAIAPCLNPRRYWNPKKKQIEMKFYKRWVEKKGDRPFYLWNYYCFPALTPARKGYREFPGFNAHTLAKQIKMYHADGVRGIFCGGISEQVDYYMTMKMYDDPSIDVDDLLGEFFSRYFGTASEPMKKFYLRIEEIYMDPNSYPEEVRTGYRNFVQTEEFAWKYLGTEERMKELAVLIEKARRFAVTETEKKRVALWEKGVWDYMVDGRRMYLEKQSKSQ